MTEPIREILLSNGLTVRFFDHTRRYFGDYHQVRINICCEVPLTAELFDDEQSFRSAQKLFGANVQYLKEIEHQGVPTASTAETAGNVVQHFIDHSMSYFQSPEFPKKLAQSRLKQAQVKSRSFIAMHRND